MQRLKFGLLKLQEECGELIQISAKKSAFISADFYPDGTNMKTRLEEEIADVLAALSFVSNEMQLDESRIEERLDSKLVRYEEFMKEILCNQN